MQHRPRSTVAALALALAAAGTPLLGSTAAGAAPLAAPVAADTTGQGPKQVVLDWQPVAGATGYVVQVGVDESWSDDPVLELTTAATRITLPVWLPHADYLWRVAAKQGTTTGRWSRSGEAQSFTRAWPERATPLEPAQGRRVTTIPTFRWTPVATASEYQLQVSTSPAFDSPGPGTQTQNGEVTETCFTTRTEVTPVNGQASARNRGAGDCAFPSVFTENRSLYWRVRPLDQVAGEVREVVTAPVVDEGISHRPPTKAEELDTSSCPKPVPTPTATGTPTPTASGTAAPDVPDPTPSASTSASPTPSPSATSGAGSGSCEPANPVEKGSWSAPVGFTYQFDTAPFVQEQDYRELGPVVPGPLPSGLCTTARVCRDFPTIDWEPVDGASSYRVYVSLDAAYSNIHEIVETLATSWTPNAAWRNSTVRSSYFYAVQPCTREGCGAVTPTPDSFRIAKPAVARLGQRVTRDEVVLAWQDYADTLRDVTGQAPTSEAYAYRVQVARADDEDFAEPVDDALVDATAHVSPDEDYGQGAFRWRVQALDASGHRLPWSAPSTFLRDTVAPTVVRVAPTSGVDATAAVRVQLSEPVTGVSAGSVTLLSAGRPVPATLVRSGALVTLRPARPLVPGARYVLRLTSALRDAAGNPVTATSVPVTVRPVADDTSPVFRFAAGWARAAASDARGGTFRVASRRTGVTFDAYGTGVVLGGCSGTASGRFEVRVDGVLRVRGDAYRAYSRCGTLATVSGLPRGQHTVQVTVLGTRRAASRGTAVGVDALRALP